MQHLGGTMHQAWSDIEDGVIWATTPGKGKIRLMAEGLPDGGWEWTVWRAIRPDDFQCGCLPTQAAARAAAEQAAQEMAAADTRTPARPEPRAFRLASAPWRMGVSGL